MKLKLDELKIQNNKNDIQKFEIDNMNFKKKLEKKIQDKFKKNKSVIDLYNERIVTIGLNFLNKKLNIELGENETPEKILKIIKNELDDEKKYKFFGNSIYENSFIYS